MDARKNGERKGDTRGREGAPDQEVHENRLHSLSESAEGSYWLRGSRGDKCSRWARKLIVLLVKNDLMLCIYHRSITPSLYNQIT